MGNRNPRVQNPPNTQMGTVVIGRPQIPQHQHHNNQHHNNQFRDPGFSAAIELSLASAPLPDGWDEVTSSKGQRYFVDHLNKSTSWDDPRLADLMNTRRSNKKKYKPPKYRDDLYGKVRRFTSKLRNLQNDEGQLLISVRRENLFQDSYELISNLDSTTLTRRLMIKFVGEDGLDYGGMSREWFLSITEEFFSAQRNLFVKHPKGYFYMVKKHSEVTNELCELYRFVGLVLGLAIYHCRLFFGHFTVIFYKSLLRKTLTIDDLIHYDPGYYQSLLKVQSASDVNDWDLTFTAMETSPTGQFIEVELKEGGTNIPVTNENKAEYIDLSVQFLIGNVEKQMDAIRKGLSSFVPEEYLNEFDPDEIEQIIGGSEPDVNDLRKYTTYHEPLNENHNLVKMFWEVASGLSQEDLKKLVKFTTGTDKVPIGGFKHLYGSNGPQQFSIMIKKVSSGLPTAHSCFNRIELPNYSDKSLLKKELLIAINEGSGFGLE